MNTHFPSSVHGMNTPSPSSVHGLNAPLAVPSRQL